MTHGIRNSAVIMLGALLSVYSTSGSPAGNDLDLADTALELPKPAPPNILFAVDDSGSMDFGVMAEGPDSEDESRLEYGVSGTHYGYTHPDPGATSNRPATNWYAFSYHSFASTQVGLTEKFLQGEGVASPFYGTWRIWNSDYNSLYYDPNTTYTPWEGEDSTGAIFDDATPSAAPYDPYRPSDGTLDLTLDPSTLEDGDEGKTYASLYNQSSVTVDAFYPARYYTWTDSDNDGNVDADEKNQLIEIRAEDDTGCSTTTVVGDAECPLTFTRPDSRTDCALDNGDGTVSCTRQEELQNFANWFSYYRKRILLARNAIGKAVANEANARIGLATLHDNGSVNTLVEPMSDSAKKTSLLNKLNQTYPSGGTPLLSQLEDAGQYYGCEDNGIFGTSYECPMLENGGACQQNYTLMLTDGVYTDSVSSVDNADSNSGNNFDGGAFADAESNTLADIAMHYYETDIDGSVLDKVVPTRKDLEYYRGTDELLFLHQHMKTYTIGFGVNGSIDTMPANTTDAFTWWDADATSGEQAIDDVRHAGYNGRGDFLSAKNPEELSNALREIFMEIGQSEGAASAVAFNTQSIDSGSLVFRAFFNVKDNSGDVEAHPIDNGGVDTDTIAWANGTAAEQLDDKVGETSDTRTIITYQDTGDSSSTGIPFQWDDLSTTQQTDLHDGGTRGQDRLNWLRGWSEHEGELQADGSGGFREREEGKYLGDIVHSAPVFVGAPPFFGRNNPPYPTGDTDLYPEFKQQKSDRKEMLYVGANDGMLHGFNANTGEEEFAYVPNAVFDGLAELPDPAYEHRYYVDSTPAVNDAFVKTDSSGSRDWSTVLVGGLGAGGRGLYALDITDPPPDTDPPETQSTRETNMAAKVMWEFTAADDNDLGYTFGEPLIAISNHEDGDGEHKWVALLGNGYNSGTGNAALFALDLAGGLDGDWGASDYKKIDANAAPAAGEPKNGIGGFRGVDSNKDGAVDLVYAGDLQGNLHRFSLSDASMANWGYDGVLFEAAYFEDGTAQPITTAPVVIQHPDGGLLVIFGTGSWMTKEDKTTDDIQSIYGVWDPTPTGSLSGPVTTANLTEQKFINQTSREHGFVVRTLSNNEVNYSAQSGNISNHDRGWRIDLDMPPAGSIDDGSKANAEFPGERLVRRLQLRGGLVFGNTVIPKPTVDPDGDGTEEEQLCQLGAGGFELGFNPLTGGPGDKVIFDLSEDGDFTDADNVGDTEGVEYIVTGRRFDDATPADSSFIGSRRVTQTSDKELHETETNTEPDVDEGRHSWREIGF